MIVHVGTGKKLVDIVWITGVYTSEAASSQYGNGKAKADAPKFQILEPSCINPFDFMSSRVKLQVLWTADEEIGYGV
jgi:hypothetical protein